MELAIYLKFGGEEGDWAVTKVVSRRPSTPAPIIVTGREWASVGGVQVGSFDSSWEDWRGGGPVGEVEKERICCREVSLFSLEGGLKGHEVVDVDSEGWGKRDRKVAEKRSGGKGCFDGLVFRIRCSARATARGSHIGQTCEEIRIVAIAFFQVQ
jgi:hypothetical protein